MGIKGLENFKKQLNAEREKEEKKINTRFQKGVAFLFERIVLTTPVDPRQEASPEAKAEGNWRAGALHPGQARGHWMFTTGTNRVSRLSESLWDKDGAQTIGRANPRIAKIKLGSNYTIYNPVPYVGVKDEAEPGRLGLESGYSDQAPNGIVKPALDEFETFYPEFAVDKDV